MPIPERERGREKRKWALLGLDCAFADLLSFKRPFDYALAHSFLQLSSCDYRRMPCLTLSSTLSFFFFSRCSFLLIEHIGFDLVFSPIRRRWQTRVLIVFDTTFGRVAAINWQRSKRKARVHAHAERYHSSRDRLVVVLISPRVCVCACVLCCVCSVDWICLQSDEHTHT